MKGGETYGATGDLSLLGFDHTKLSCRRAGRDFRLTDVHGKDLGSTRTDLQGD